MRPGTLTTRERDPRRKALTGSCMRDTRNEQAGRSQVGRHPPSRQWHLPTSTSAPSHLNARNRNCGKWELGAVLAAAAAPQFANIALRDCKSWSNTARGLLAKLPIRTQNPLQLSSYSAIRLFFSILSSFPRDSMMITMIRSREGGKEGRREGPLVKAFATPAAAAAA